MKNYYIVTSYEKFREMVAEDAELWKGTEDLTVKDVMNEYPSFNEMDDGCEPQVFETEEEATDFRDKNRDESLYGVFSLEELAEKTLEYMSE